MGKKNILIVCYGFDFENSTNANAHCLNSLLEHNFEDSNIIIITDCEVGQVSNRGNIKVYKIAVSSNVNSKKRLLNFIKLCKPKLDSLLKIVDFYSILTISFPFPISSLGLYVKDRYPEIKLVNYFLDPYASNSALRLRNLLFIFRLFKECFVIYKSNNVIVASNLSDLYKKLFFIFSKKIIYLPIPILNIEKSNIVKSSNTVKKIVFAGSLDYKYRNPNYLLDLLFKINIKLNIPVQIEFYTNSAGIIDGKIVEKFNNHLKIYDFINKNDLKAKLSSADILLNIGNKGLKSSLPSKIIEYIGYKKPILNYYFEDCDQSVKFLKDYPNSFSFKHNINSEKNIYKIINFIESSDEKNTDEAQLLASYKEFLIPNISKKFMYILSN